MKIINISRNTFRDLDRLALNKKIYNTEAAIYVIPAKTKWMKEEKLLKKLYADEGDSFGNKLLTVNALIDRRELLNIPELVLPERIAVMNGNIIGFTMPYIKNKNMDVILQDYRYNPLFKRELLKQAGYILKEIKALRDNGIVTDFFVNDVHEGNFIYNMETKRINIVDLDSCRIAGNKPFAAKYLTPFSPIVNLTYKYKVNTDNRYPGYIIANENSDIYCYNMMVLNHLYGDKATRMNIKTFYLYLDYLRNLGYDYEFLECLAKLFEPANNVSVYDYLGTLPNDYEIIGKSNHNTFKMQLKK